MITACVTSVMQQACLNRLTVLSDIKFLDTATPHQHHDGGDTDVQIPKLLLQVWKTFMNHTKTFNL